MGFGLLGLGLQQLFGSRYANQSSMDAQIQTLRQREHFNMLAAGAFSASAYGIANSARWIPSSEDREILLPLEVEIGLLRGFINCEDLYQALLRR